MHHLEAVFRIYHLGNEHAKDSFVLGVGRWAWQVLIEVKQMEAVALLAALPEILAAAWRNTHIRCQLMEHLVEMADLVDESEFEALAQRIVDTLEAIRAAVRTKEGRLAANTLLDLEKRHPESLPYMTIVWCAEDYRPSAGDRYAWRDHTSQRGMPMAIFYPEDHRKIPITVISSGDSVGDIRSSLLSGQQAAFDSLRYMIRAHAEKLSAGGIKPRLHGLLVGPSGSGKTHVVRAVARALELPIYEQSAASWMPNGSRTETSSAQKVAKFVAANESGLIYIDEVEKPFPPNLMTSSAWERANADEMMSILDAKVAYWDGWTEELAQKLESDFFIVLSGAWQHAYLAELPIHELLGGTWCNLSIADKFLEENHLPAELLNRVSTNVIEVLPPSPEELARIVLAVQRDLGLREDECEAAQVAREIVADRKGVRGIEAYMLQHWMAREAGSGR